MSVDNLVLFMGSIDQLNRQEPSNCYALQPYAIAGPRIEVEAQSCKEGLELLKRELLAKQAMGAVEVAYAQTGKRVRIKGYPINKQ